MNVGRVLSEKGFGCPGRGRDTGCPIPPAQIRTGTLMHTALILDAKRQSARWGKDGERAVQGANAWPLAACAPSSGDVSDCDELKLSATSELAETGIRANCLCFPEPRGS